jgi:hypothetical protein
VLPHLTRQNPSPLDILVDGHYTDPPLVIDDPFTVACD